MSNSSYTPVAKIDAAAYLDASDGMSRSITTSISQISEGISPLAKWRMNRVRGQEAVALTEAALREYMAAKREVFAYQCRLTKDHAKKVMLEQNIKDTVAVEGAIARTIAATAAEFERLVRDNDTAALREEARQVREADAMLAAGELSERRHRQKIERIEASTDAVIARVERATYEILNNLEGRFQAALKNS